MRLASLVQIVWSTFCALIWLVIVILGLVFFGCVIAALLGR